jgi:hypothetical protein
MKPAVDDGAALRADQPDPARRVTTLFDRLSALAGTSLGALGGLAASVHGEELDAKMHGAQRLGIRRNGLGHASSNSILIAGVVATTKRSRPSWTTPHTRSATQSPASSWS